MQGAVNMTTNSRIAKSTLSQKLGQLIRLWREWLLLMFSAIGGVLMSGTSLFGASAPFGAALCAALPWRYVPTAALGAVVGSVFGDNEDSDMGHIAAILLVVVAKWLFSQGIVKLREQYAAVCSALFASVLSSVLILTATSAGIYAVISALAEIMLCCGATYFFAQSFFCISKGLDIATRAERSCTTISFSILITSLAPLELGGVSFGRIIAVVVILLAARCAKEAGGAIAGIIAGITMGFSSGDFAYTTSAYAFGGLIGGVFGRVGNLATAATFIIVNALSAIFIGTSMDAYSAVLEIFVASVIFMLLPNSALRYISIAETNKSSTESTARAALNHRMRDVSSVMLQISKTTHEVSRRLAELKRDNTSDIYTNVAARVCKRCGHRQTCWQQNYSDTINALTECVRTMRRDGTLNRDHAPAYLTRTCCKLNSMIDELNAQFQLQISRNGIACKVAQVRSVVTDQFEGMALMIDELANELSSRRQLENEHCRRIREYFDSIAVNYNELSCYLDSGGYIHIELRLPAAPAPRFDRLAAVIALSDLMETDFDPPQEQETGKNLLLIFSEKANYSIDLGIYQLTSGQNRLCGDSCTNLRNRAGTHHLILSDGMGSGGSAAVDSTMASSLIAQLLDVGISHKAALKMVNSALLIKSGDESLATIDVCSIDLFTGKAFFYKAGAAPTYILHAGKARTIESTSLPAGILRGIAFEQSMMTLDAGDIILMVSDGVTATGTEWVSSELQMLAGHELQQLCESIANTAIARRNDTHSDDITVMAAKLNHCFGQIDVVQ